MISRAQEPEQLYAEGGITSIRQPYFLGKAVKKIGKGLKKVVKSPLGKAALLGGLGWAANAGHLGGAGAGWFPKFKGLFSEGKLEVTSGGASHGSYPNSIQVPTIGNPSGDSIGIKSMMYLSLGFDHRLIDGAGGSRFIDSIRENIENVNFESLL